MVRPFPSRRNLQDPRLAPLARLQP